MEAMNEALQFILKVLEGLFTLIISLIKENISDEVLTNSIIIIGTVAIIYIITKLSSKTPRRRKYRRY